MSSEPIVGLYEQLLTVELERLLSGLEPGQATLAAAEPGDTHVAVANHLRRILERALHAVPENERLTRQAGSVTPCWAGCATGKPRKQSPW